MEQLTEQLQSAVKAADLKRAEDIVVLDLENISLLADYFMICHGTNTRQVEAIANEIIEKVEEAGGVLNRIEGMDTARWILIDFGDLVVHVFMEEEREFYQLEKLWADAPMIDITSWVTD